MPSLEKGVGHTGSTFVPPLMVGTTYPAIGTTGTWLNSFPVTNVMWQTTSSNATYCSASSALSIT